MIANIFFFLFQAQPAFLAGVAVQVAQAGLLAGLAST